VHLTGNDVDSGDFALAPRADGSVADGKGNSDSPVGSAGGIPAFRVAGVTRDATRATGDRVTSPATIAVR